jgi:hypothetical protein
LTITFNAKKTGVGKVSVSKGSVLAADGKGTDVYVAGTSASFTVTDAPPAASVAPDPAPADPNAGQDLSGNPPPPAPTIISSTNPKPDAWYATSSATFSWIDTVDITAVRTMISDSASTTPTQSLKGVATSTTLTVPHDGVWYFIIQLKNDAGWGAIGSRKVQVDTTPPTAFSVALLAPSGAGGVAKLSFKTDDAVSGIDHYELLIGSTTDVSIQPQDASDGTYPVPPQAGGPAAVTIRAYDKAGNMQEATTQLTLPKVDKPVAVATDAAAPAAGGINFGLIFSIVFAFIIGILATWNSYLRKGVVAERAKILKRVAEVGDKNDRVFSAMREEFEQMVSDFDEKPQLTPQERDFLEGIKEVLDISEELVDSGMEELKKLVRG